MASQREEEAEMSDVKRYSGFGLSMLENAPTCTYVAASDYDALRAELARVTAENEMLTRMLRQAQDLAISRAQELEVANNLVAEMQGVVNAASVFVSDHEGEAVDEELTYESVLSLCAAIHLYRDAMEKKYERF